MFRRIAESANYVFWTVWGAGLGAFGMVLAKAVDLGGVTPPLYLGVLTVMMGGALGLVSSRGMDSLSDARRMRRKRFTARMRIHGLRDRVQSLAEAIHKGTDDGTKSFNTPNDVPLNTALSVIMHFGLVEQAAASPPEFDEIITSEEDLAVADKCNALFLTFVDNDVPTAKDNDGQQRSWALAQLREGQHFLDVVQILDEMGDHFRKDV